MSSIAPITALARWLAQIQYNHARRLETGIENVTRADEPSKPLRGVHIADDLVLTRNRTFYQIIGLTAVLLTPEQVAARYNLADLQARYRSAVESWKSQRRRSA